MRSSPVLQAILAGLALVTVSLPSPGTVTATTVRKAAPDFTLTDSKGGAIKLSDFKGKVVLLDFWATWCGGCKVEIPWYVEFEDKYKDRGLATIGVSMDEGGWKAVTPFLEKNKINYPIVIGNEDLAKLYGADALPMTLLIDRDGKIAASHVGLVNKASFESEIRILLQSGHSKRD